MMYYNLDENNNPVPCKLSDWEDLYETAEGNKRRRVAEDEINGSRISTVFLGIDHGYGFTSNPMLFETMVFNSEDDNCDGYQTRCSTWNGAIQMHKDAIEWVKNGCKEHNQ